MRLPNLMEYLHKLKWKHVILEGKFDSMVVILERGGRILGVYPNKNSENMLWVCPDLADPAISFDKYETNLHWNSGGERTWLSPETEYHIRELQSWADSYIVQKTIDPGQYQLNWDSDAQQRGSARWGQENTAEAFRTKAKVQFRLEKSCRLIEDPLVVSGVADGLESYQFIGYETVTSIETAAEEKKPPLSLWTLMQMPAGGEFIVPTYGLVQPEYLYAQSSSEHVTVRKGEIRLRVDAAHFQKLSIKGIHATGRLGYIRRGANNEGYLLVRQLKINPSESYCDVPIHNLADFGYCIQIYNDDGSNGAFGELEYHTPQLRQADGRTSDRDYSQIWCYTGTYETIMRLSEILLGTQEGG